MLTKTINTAQTSIHGVGVGLRSLHFQNILEQRPKVSWFEALSDNYLHCSGPAFHHLCQVAAHYPVTLHGVGLAIGSADDCNIDYLKKLSRLAKAVQSPLISDHLCWTSAHGQYAHELIPFPYNEDNLRWLSKKISRVQDALGQAIMLENVSRYVTYENNDYSEAEFLKALSQQTGCGILLDVNNCYVNQFNHGDDSIEYFNVLNPDSVWQIHLGGYTDKGVYLLDSHSEEIHPPVWSLYAKALRHFPNTPTLIEWDNDIPPLEKLIEQAQRAEKIFYQEQSELS